MLDKMVDFSDLIGKTFETVTIIDDERIVFESNDGKCVYTLLPDEDYSRIDLESIDGDIEKYLPGEKILDAYESFSDASDDDECTDDSCTWSFYVIRTMLDTFTIRFFGSSNGYYSEIAFLYRSGDCED